MSIFRSIVIRYKIFQLQRRVYRLAMTYWKIMKKYLPGVDLQRISYIPGTVYYIIYYPREVSDEEIQNLACACQRKIERREGNLGENRLCLVLHEHEESCPCQQYGVTCTD